MMYFGLTTIFLLISGCAKENLPQIPPIPAKETVSYSYIPEGNQLDSPKSTLINRTISTAYPHLRAHEGHWLLSSRSLQLVFPAKPALPYESSKQDIIIDSYLWSAKKQGWSRQKHIPPINLSLSNTPQQPFQPLDFSGDSESSYAELEVRYQSKLGDGGLVTYKLLDKLNVLLIYFSGFSELKTPPTLHVWNHLESAPKRSEGLLNVSHQEESLNILGPEQSPIQRSALESSIAINQQIGLAAITWGISGDLISPYLSQLLTRCGQSGSNIYSCLETIESERFTQDAKIESTGDYSETLTLTDLQGKFLARVFKQAPSTITIPLGADTIMVSQLNSKTSLSKGQTIRLHRSDFRNHETPTKLNHNPTEPKNVYTFKDSHHNLAFKVISSRPIHHFQEQWESFLRQNKGPKIFLFPRFVEYKFPSSTLELTCTDIGLSQHEVYTLTKAAGIDRINLTPCQSSRGRELFLQLRKKLHRLGQRDIEVIDGTNIQAY